jgi:hypothetical protein
MIKRRYIVLILMILFNTMAPAIGQIKRNAFTIDNDQMVLYIDLKLAKADIDSLLRIADIKGITVDNLLKGNYTGLEKIGWTIKKLQNNQLMLLKPLDELGTNPLIQPILITQTQMGNTDEKRPGYPGVVSYGINNFGRVTVHELPSGLTRFFLPGNLAAKKVLLSGNFNNWNTLRGLMLKTDSGWIADINLRPGEYLYKFIVNGHWIHDPNNRLHEDDGYDDYNSIYYRYNHTFKLKGFAKANRVIVAGSFNKWNANEIVLTAKAGEWYKSLYIGEGMNTYRFLVDGKWITDPANPNTRADVSGTVSSVLNLGTNVVFKLKGYPNAKNVTVAGDFNSWKPGEIHLKKTGDGWLLVCTLAEGNYGYKFVVDGRWMPDPANPHQYGTGNEINSLIAVRPTHTFILKGYANAKTIRIGGTFNDWNYNGYTLKHEGTDWRISLNLKPGKYLYKFIVDGNWIIDPGNKLWEQNQYDTGNSVLWIEP